MLQLTKKQLIEHLSDETNLPQIGARRLLEALTEVIHDGLSNGHAFTLPGVGKLSVRKRGPRNGRHPRTGAPITIKARKAVVFTPSKGLVNTVNHK